MHLRRDLKRLAIILYFYRIEIVKTQDAIQALGALASEPRLGIYRLLVKRGPDGYTPGELSERLGVPAPTLSFHLKELIHARLVMCRRKGRHLYYSPSFAQVDALISFLTESCCSLADADCGPDCKPLSTSAQDSPRRKHA